MDVSFPVAAWESVSTRVREPGMALVLAKIRASASPPATVVESRATSVVDEPGAVAVSEDGVTPGTTDRAGSLTGKSTGINWRCAKKFP
jgi:hypothetical protein